MNTEPLELEPLQASHAHVLYEFLRDDGLYRFIPQDPPVSEQALRERYTRLEKRQSPDGREVWLNWAARLLKTADYVGTFQATVLPNRIAYAAYMVFAPYQGRGYATQGLLRVVAYLSSEHHVNTIVAEIDTRNAASIALVERVGFTRVATVRDADFFNGTSSDEYRYELDTRANQQIMENV